MNHRRQLLYSLSGNRAFAPSRWAAVACVAFGLAAPAGAEPPRYDAAAPEDAPLRVGQGSEIKLVAPADVRGAMEDGRGEKEPRCEKLVIPQVTGVPPIPASSPVATVSNEE